MKRVLLWVIPPIWALFLPFWVHKEKVHIEFGRLLNSSCNTFIDLIIQEHLGKVIHVVFNHLIRGAVPENINKFFRHKILFWYSIILFLSTWNTFLWNVTFFLLRWSTFLYNINLFLSTPDYFLCNVKLFVSTQKCFSCNTRFLFWTSFKMLFHSDIFLLSRNNKNIITCQKK